MDRTCVTGKHADRQRRTKESHMRQMNMSIVNRQMHSDDKKTDSDDRKTDELHVDRNINRKMAKGHDIYDR